MDMETPAPRKVPGRRTASVARAAKGRPTPEDWIEVLTNPTTGPVVAGRINGVGRNASYKGCEAGDIPAFKVGGQWRVPTEPLLQRLGITSIEARDNALQRARDELEARRRRSAAPNAQEIQPAAA